jgi:endonuclease-8
VPEGDTVAYAANRIRPVLEGRTPDTILTPQPRHARDRWPERLAGRTIEGIETHGKHLFIRFGPRAIQARQDRADRMSSGCFARGLVLHSHLGMSGLWGVYGPSRRWSRSEKRAWIVLRCGEESVVEFDGPLLELLTDARVRFDQRLSALGPDVLAEEFDSERFLRRLRADDPTRAIGDALLDQRNVAGIGNIWKAEGCWEAGVDPWRAVAEVSDADAIGIIDAMRPRMLRSAQEGPRSIRPRVYGLSARPCSRCGSAITASGQGDANRMTYWCPGCQH